MIYTTTQGIKFEIIESDDEIKFLDENNETITWHNTEFNLQLVYAMVKELIGG